MSQAAMAAHQLSELHLPASADELSSARSYAAGAAASFGLDADGCYDFAYAANEAVTNAIRHGAPDGQGRIHLSVVVHGDRLTLVVRDYGTFAAPSQERAVISEHGRGLSLMSTFTDEVRLCVEPGHTAVHLSKTRTPSSRPAKRGC